MTEHHYEIRLEHDLAAIKEEVASIARSVVEASKKAVEALEHRDHDLAYQTIIDDNPINRVVEDCDRMCHAFVARHLPAAGHLRFISSVMRLNVALERIGDYATTICRVSVQLEEPLQEDLMQRVRVLSEGSISMLEQAVTSFIDGDPGLARGTIVLEEQIDQSFRGALDRLIHLGEGDGPSTGDLFGRLVILSTLERISDQSKNICEYAIFAATGETKRRKPASVLFLDRDGSALGPMAVSIATKAYPQQGRYSTACLAPSGDLNPEIVSKMEQHGHDLSLVHPASLDGQDIQSQKVVVILEGSREDYLDTVPFNTAVVQWHLSDETDSFASLYARLAERIGDLMIALRGE